MYDVSSIILGLILLANGGSAFFPTFTFYSDAQNGALTGRSSRAASLCRWYNVQPPYVVGSSSRGTGGTNWGGSAGGIDSILNAIYPINGLGTAAASGQRRPAVVVRVDESPGAGSRVTNNPRRGGGGAGSEGGPDYDPNAGEDYYYEGGRRASAMGPQNYGDAATSYDDYSGYYYDDYADPRAYDWLPAATWPATSVGGIYERLYGVGMDLPSLCSICAMMG